MYLCENSGLGFGMCHQQSDGFQNVHVFSDVPLCSLVVTCHRLEVTDLFTCKAERQRVGYEICMWQEWCHFILHFCYCQIRPTHIFETYIFMSCSVIENYAAVFYTLVICWQMSSIIHWNWTLQKTGACEQAVAPEPQQHFIHQYIVSSSDLINYKLFIFSTALKLV